MAHDDMRSPESRVQSVASSFVPGAPRCKTYRTASRARPLPAAALPPWQNQEPRGSARRRVVENSTVRHPDARLVYHCKSLAKCDSVLHSNSSSSSPTLFVFRASSRAWSPRQPICDGQSIQCPELDTAASAQHNASFCATNQLMVIIPANTAAESAVHLLALDSLAGRPIGLLPSCPGPVQPGPTSGIRHDDAAKGGEEGDRKVGGRRVAITLGLISRFLGFSCQN